ncbi:MAG: MerR family transcriptional regulator [Hyphomonadaceae bacterium]|nr:MerR family transcriptional regulator [Hyphomonadaceae bacterium]
MMRIGELEQVTGLKRSTIRVYERMGLLRAKDGVPGNGYRHFDKSHVERIGAIRLAQSLGFSLKEIAALMDAWEGGRLTKAQKLRAMEARLAAVEEKRRQLQALSQWLKRLRNWVEAGEIGPKPRLR